MIDNIVFIDHLPTIDLHGYDRDTARVATNDFIRDNVKMQNEFVVIIHGQGNHIIRDEVHKTLKQNKMVEDYKLYIFNTGCTIVKIIKNN